MFYFWQIVDGRDMCSRLELPVVLSVASGTQTCMHSWYKNTCTLLSCTVPSGCLRFCSTNRADTRARSTSIHIGESSTMMAIILWCYFLQRWWQFRGHSSHKGHPDGLRKRCREQTTFTHIHYNAFGLKILTPKLRHQGAICWLGKELPWQNGLTHIYFMNKTCFRVWMYVNKK